MTEIKLWCEGGPAKAAQGFTGPHPRELVISFKLDGSWPDGRDFWEVTYAPRLEWQRIVAHPEGDAPTETRGSVLYAPVHDDVRINLKDLFRGEPSQWGLRERMVIRCPHPTCTEHVVVLRRRCDAILSGMKAHGMSDLNIKVLDANR